MNFVKKENNGLGEVIKTIIQSLANSNEQVIPEVKSLESQNKSPEVEPLESQNKSPEVKPPISDKPEEEYYFKYDEKSVDLKKPTVLFMSDFEGCVEQSSNKINQTRQLCDEKTFEKIINLLDKNTNFQVVFLGDYFDLGNKIKETIEGIIKCKVKYPTQVHIILGNRDINKMRICVEAKYKMENAKLPTWSSWNFLSKDYKPEDDELVRTKKLLQKTYGAPDLLKFVGDDNEKHGLDLMKAIFDGDFGEKLDNDEFVQNCRKLFYYGKLISIIDIPNHQKFNPAKLFNKSTKVLCSHAGTYNLNIFRFKNILQLNMNNKLEYYFNQKNYFDSIEKTRKLLQNNLIIEAEDINIVTDFYNSILTDLMKKIFKIGMFDGYNGKISIKTPLSNIIFDKSKREYMHKYLLLQAMGLKPDAGIENFLSPIDSCGLNGCVSIKKIPGDFATYIKEQGIKCIAHGHVPFCGTVPLIHQDEGIGFLSCDTSNGNRPDSYNDLLLAEIPISYMQSDCIGIASIVDYQQNMVGLSRTITKGYPNNGEKKPEFNFMIGEFKMNELPTLELSNVSSEIKKVKYPKGIFQLNGDGVNRFKPASGIPTVSGGKRKSKKYNKKIKGHFIKGKRSQKNKKTILCKHGCKHYTNQK
jgi:hypothetical protein